MIVVVDDESSTPVPRRFRSAPPVDPKFGRGVPLRNEGLDDVSLSNFARMNGGRDGDEEIMMREDGSLRGEGSVRSFNIDNDRARTPYAERTGTPYTIRIDGD